MDKQTRVERFPYHREINNELLIEEVKKRPAIYDKNLKEYNDHDFKKNLWEEIFEKMFQSIWHTLDDAQKEMRGIEVIKRWNNLRSSFTRDLKTQKDPNNRKRKYVYFNKLLFLLDHLQHSSQYSELESNQDTEESDQFEEEKIKKKNPNEKEDNRQKKLENYVDYSINKMKEEIQSRINNTNSSDGPNAVKLSYETCPDTNFALSLVPSLKMVPIEQKIDAQIEILNVLKKYTQKETVNMSVVKCERERSMSEDSSIIMDLFGTDE